MLRRLRVTPVPAAAVAVAHGVTSVAIGLLSLIILMILARLIFGMQMAGSWPSLIVVYLCGACALVPMGLLVGATARDIRTAPAIANLLFFPLMFLSGSAFPFAMLPDGVKTFARVLPTTYLNESYSGVIVAGQSAWPMAGTLAVLIATGVIGIILTSMLFRWEGTDPIPRRSIAMIAAAFAVTLGIAALAAPAFRIAEMPGTRRIDSGAASGQVLVLRGATVLDGLGGRIANARVVIRDHRVAEVSLDDDRVALPEGATVEDVRGRFMIPGLFDSHVHWGGSGGIGSSPIEQTEDRLSHDYAATLASGVTSVISLTDDVAAMEKLAVDVASTKRNAPRTFYSGPSVTARGGHPAAMFGFMPGLADLLTRQVETPEEARAAIADLDRRRVDLVKLVLEPGFPGRHAAEAEGRGVSRGHGRSEEAPDAHDGARRHRRGCAAGDRGRRERVGALRAWLERRHDRDDGREEGDVHADARGARLGLEAGRHSRRGRGCPTPGDAGDHAVVARSQLAACHDGVRRPMATTMEGAFKGSIEQVRRAIKAGVPVLAGSDGGNPATFHGISLVRELELLGQAGMPLTTCCRPRPRVPPTASVNQASAASPPAQWPISSCSRPIRPKTHGAYRRVVSVYLGGRKLDPAP